MSPLAHMTDKTLDWLAHYRHRVGFWPVPTDKRVITWESRQKRNSPQPCHSFGSVASGYHNQFLMYLCQQGMAHIRHARLRLFPKFVAGCLLLVPHIFLAQSQAPKRQKIGLALSGGSALGLAHIGVLKYFEEHRIPIDYIAGTSMGGLVGGFYATGSTPADLEKIAMETDWSEMLSPNPRFANLPIVEKRDWNRPFGDLSLRFGQNFSLPTGINSGESLALFFSRQTAAYANLESFGELPIPFRCVATDLVSADAFVIDRGSLPKALRATMALPGIFTPVVWGDKVLIDGGLVENLPVEPARQMGSDIVIAVLLEGKHTSVVQFRSLSTVLKQTVSIPVIQNERRSAALADLVIHVQTGDFSSTDFGNAAKLIQKGYEAAQAQAAELARFALSQEEWTAYLAARQRRVRPPVGKGPLVAVVSPRPSVQSAAQHEAYRALGAVPVSRAGPGVRARGHNSSYQPSGRLLWMAERRNKSGRLPRGVTSPPRRCPFNSSRIRFSTFR